MAALLMSLVTGYAVQAQDALAERVTPGPLSCDVDDYSGLLAHDEVSRGHKNVYAVPPGVSFYGSRDMHARMHAEFPSLTFDAVRAPLVMADMATGRLHVFDCATERCQKIEMLWSAPRACAAALQADRCILFAARVEDRYFCTLAVGLDQRGLTDPAE